MPFYLLLFLKNKNIYHFDSGAAIVAVGMKYRDYRHGKNTVVFLRALSAAKHYIA